MKSLFPEQEVDEIVRRLDRYEDLSYRVVARVLKSHHFEEEYYRLEEGQHIGVSKQRILTRVCLEFFDGSWSRTISFYETCNREDDEPHYEDLTTTLLVAFAATFLATVAAELAKATVAGVRRLAKESREIDTRRSNVEMIFHQPVRNVVLATALRDQYRLSQSQDARDLSLAREEHDAILGDLRRQLGGTEPIPVDRVGSDETEEKFRRFCRNYFSRHGLPSEDPATALLEDIVRGVLDEIEELPEQSGEEYDNG